ncbi:MAG: hypothetical protein V7L11_02880 [Nostoc sp.]|uniref:hypothetical protein n=1 Tax=Nostoc sp. TaxID=1180 RepID=UPI002FF8C4A5
MILPSALAKPQTSDTSAIQEAQTNLTQVLEEFVKTIEQASGDRTEKLQATISVVISLLETLKKLS